MIDIYFESNKERKGKGYSRSYYQVFDYAIDVEKAQLY